jgi:uncharacterized protein (DUF58 family)
MKQLIGVLGLLLLVSLLGDMGCASRSVTPETKEVKVSREAPSSKCEEVGRVTGTSNVRGVTYEELLEDMRREAANKNANYVKVEQYSDMGTAVTGVAFRCD